MLEQITNLPPQARGLLMFAAGGSIVSLLFAFDRNLGLIAVTGLFITACLLAGYKRILSSMQKRKASSMSGQISEQAGSAPVGINDPAKRARLDDLKRTFEGGLDRFRTSGKDVYKLPWYLIVGEPGSGKTEAVRHCNVGFPPGLQDELQGTGGTINMNWWFTNHAVMLDTAGRLMFEEVKPGETSEWREFLQLLRRNRPNCPVNGLLLVIPAESLIRDTAEQITAKGGKIAQQLDLIQRTLDIRFPVFILITKCDLLSGFREFFEGLNDPATQHQMIGWANPEPRDSVFRADNVTQYLESVVDRVRKRRLGLMRDPVPEKEGGKRADEVDALFGLPHSLSLIAPRLRMYLEKVFVAGEWSAKPLFLRGIFFTSAMREGAALDQELAEALGVSLDDLPEGRAWERERAYFLRDLFMEKAFREKGLVTRATNTNALLRKRRVYLYGAGIAALITFIGFSWLGYQQLKSSIGRQSALWAHGKREWNSGVWHPLVQRDSSGQVKYVGDEPAFPGEGTTLVQYHDSIRDVCEKPIQIGWVFKPVAKVAQLDSTRFKAQRILFEGSVISPLVKETRNEMSDPARDSAPLPTDLPAAMVREAKAVAALINIESDVVKGKGDVIALPDTLLLPLIRYTTNQERAADTGNFQQLANVLRWTYQQNSAGIWPPAWLTGGNAALAGNRPIAMGLDRMIRYANESARTQEASLAEIRQLRDLLRAFRQKETEMQSNATAADPRAVYGQMHTLHEELQATKVKLDSALKDAQAKGLAGEGAFTIGAAYQRLVGGANSASQEAFEIVAKSVADYAAKPTDSINTEHPLFVQVDAKLKEVKGDITRRVAQGFTPEEQAELKVLDQTLLADFGNGKKMYEMRAATYESAHSQLFVEAPKGNLIGKNWGALSEVTSAVDRQRQSVASLKDKIADPFSAACKYYLDRAEEVRTDQVLKSYIDQTRNSFEAKFNYPLVKGGHGGMGKGGYNEAERLLADWRTDITSPALQRAPAARRAKLESFLSAVEGIGRIIPSLNGTVSVGLVSYSAAGDKSGLNKFRKVLIRGREYDTSTDSIGGSYTFFDTFNADFLDYSVTPRKSYGYNQNVMELVNRARGSGRVTITVDGMPIALNVHANAAPPDLNNLPDKQRILATLN